MPVGNVASRGSVTVYAQQFFETKTWFSGASGKRDGMRHVSRPGVHVFAYGARNGEYCMQLYPVCAGRMDKRKTWT